MPVDTENGGRPHGEQTPRLYSVPHGDSPHDVTTAVFFNGVLDTAQSSLADSSRDWATLVQAVEMVVLALVARHAPHTVNPRPP